MIDFVTALREALQDLIVPEFRTLQAEVRLQGERLERLEQRMDEQFRRVDERFDRLYQDMDQRFQRVDQQFQRVDERFQRVDERFQRVDERFERLHQEVLGVANAVAAVGGKIDLLVDHIVDVRELARLSARVEQLETRVEDLDRRG